MKLEPFILIIEKSPEFRKTLKELLESEGYRVSAAASGTEAVIELRRGAVPCLILIDIVMPTLEGWALIDEIQANTNIANVPIYASAEIVHSARSFKVTGVIKRVEIDEITSIVRKHCKRRES